MADSNGNKVEFSQGMALFFFEDMKRKLETICSVASAAVSDEQSKDEPDENVIRLFEAITGIAEESTAVYALRDILKSMPVAA